MSRPRARRAPQRRARSSSASAATSTGQPSRSAWNCIRNPLALAPPSARRTPTLERERVEHVGDLERDRLERRADEMRARRAAREPGDEPARVGLPVRRAEPRQCRDEDDAVGRVDLAREPSLSAADVDHAETVAEPLHRGAADEHRALERVLRRAAGGPLRPSSAGPPPGCPRARRRSTSTKLPVPYVAFASPGAKQPCPKSAACWSPAIPAIGTRRAEERRLADHLGGADDVGQQRAVDAEEREQLVVPGERPRGRGASSATRSSRRWRARRRP